MNQVQLVPGTAPEPAISLPQKDIFNFFDLPRELRDVIYDLLSEDTGHVGPDGRHIRHSHSHVWIEARRAIEKLQRVSHQFSTEYAERVPEVTALRLIIKQHKYPRQLSAYWINSLSSSWEVATTLDVFFSMKEYDTRPVRRRMFQLRAEWTMRFVALLPLLKRIHLVFWFGEEETFRHFVASGQASVLENLPHLVKMTFVCRDRSRAKSIRGQNFWTPEAHQRIAIRMPGKGIEIDDDLIARLREDRGSPLYQGRLNGCASGLEG